MPKFQYQVRDARGAPATGVLNAADINEASRTLRSEGNVIVDLREQPGDQAKAQQQAAPTSKARAKRDDVIFFANQLAVMVDTGVPLVDSLDAIAENVRHENFRAVLTDISDQVKAGVDFSTALRRYPRIFSRLFVAMVKASEASGTMGKMLRRVADYLEKQRQIRRRVKGALAYPLAMLGFCVLVVTGMLVFVLPRFEKIYAGKSAVLPAPTRFLLGISAFVSGYWYVILGVLGALAVGAWMFLRRPNGKIFLDSLSLKLPVLGPMFRKACLARSLRTLATMVASGVSVLDALQIAAEVAGNVHYDCIWRSLCERLKGGARLSEEMARVPLIPACVSQMVAAGERTGQLATVLERVSGFCEEDLDTAVRTATSFIEPAMIVVMGMVVGGIALALLLPVFSLSSVVAS